MTDPDTLLATDYLQRLRHALRGLPEPEQAEIVAEIESHIAEARRKPGVRAADILVGLGDPGNLARTYLEDRQLSGALLRASPAPLLGAVLGRATRSLSALLAGVASSVLYAFALSFALTAVIKPIAPRNVGLWLDPAGVQFGFLAVPPAISAERLGWWIVPIAGIGAVLCYLLATALIKLCGRALLRRSPTHAAP